MRRFWSGSLGIVSMLVVVVPCAWCGVLALDVTPDLHEAPRFEVVVQYVETPNGSASFSVCADTSAVAGDLELAVRLADKDGLIGGWCVCPTPSELGRAWLFEMRSDLVATSTFALIDNQSRLNGHNMPAATKWTFHLGPLSAQSFHVEPGWQCPDRRPQRPGFERVEVHVLHLKDGRPVDESWGG